MFVYQRVRCGTTQILVHYSFKPSNDWGAGFWPMPIWGFQSTRLARGSWWYHRYFCVFLFVSIADLTYNWWSALLCFVSKIDSCFACVLHEGICDLTMITWRKTQIRPMREENLILTQLFGMEKTIKRNTYTHTHTHQMLTRKGMFGVFQRWWTYPEIP